METVKVSSKGQIVIPKSLRDANRIHTGDSFVVTVVGDELRLKPAPTVGQTSLKSVAGMLHRPGAKKLSDRQLQQCAWYPLLAAKKASNSR